MIIKLTGQAQERIDKNELVIVTERVDDVALLLAQMIKMGFVEILDRHLPKHWKQEGLSWGWTAVIWLAYILSEGDHRKQDQRLFNLSVVIAPRCPKQPESRQALHSESPLQTAPPGGRHR